MNRFISYSRQLSTAIIADIAVLLWNVHVFAWITDFVQQTDGSSIFFRSLVFISLVSMLLLIATNLAFTIWISWSGVISIAENRNLRWSALRACLIVFITLFSALAISGISGLFGATLLVIVLLAYSALSVFDCIKTVSDR